MNDGTQVVIDRAATTDARSAVRREWLVTNGRGGYASGSLAYPTRRYHGLLIAAPRSPNDRLATLVRLEEALAWGGQTRRLDSNIYTDGTVDPRGFDFLQSFRLESGLPVWVYAIDGFVIERRVWMPQGADACCVRLSLLSGNGAVDLQLTPLVAWRSADALQHSKDREFVCTTCDQSVEVKSDPTDSLVIAVDRGSFVLDSDWHYNFWLPEEHARGYDAQEDLFRPGHFRAHVRPGDTVTLIARLASATQPGGDSRWSLEAAVDRGNRLLEQARGVTTNMGKQLVLAADQFVVGEGDQTGIVAGYPWFGEWGRDTMLSIPGLLLATGRPEVAQDVLRRWGRQTQRGLLPNTLERGAHEFNTADASLSFAEAVFLTYNATHNTTFRDEMLTTLLSIVESYVNGTDNGISVDPQDGLVIASCPGLQLTWMDAKCGDWVVTPRRGKPVEVSALWINALEIAQALSREADQSFSHADLLHTARRSFADRFWCEQCGYLYDVIDGADGNDSTLRPNQLLALALSFPALTGERAQRVLAAVESTLLTPVGLRTLGRDAEGYQARYEGGQEQRDAAYHQGTVWPWLLGPYVAAARRLDRSRTSLLPTFAVLSAHLSEAGAGSVSEIFDAEPPHLARGCPAQAWSVAQLLWALYTIEQEPH
ncbi:MAG: amylo-alpha-1,6-glucosidase [Chloroflexi bacterium]|nr:amylo-alpha-1,6-glucosidase [Chloroflexota bacterium]